MKDKNGKIRYPVQTARVSDELWQELNAYREKEDLSWNQLIKMLNKLLNKK